MKIMVVGGGGREHAIIKKLKESPDAGQIYALPGNGGIAADAVCVPIAATELGQIVEFAVREAIDFAVVAPDDPLVMGLVDLLRTDEGGRRHRGQQILRQEPDGEVRHPDRLLPRVRRL